MIETDLVDYLDSIGVDYKIHGTDVGTNDVNIDCPYCGSDKHMGINRSTLKIFCWVCRLEGIDPRPYFVDLVKLWENCPHDEAARRYRKLKGVTIDPGGKFNATITTLPKNSFRFDSPPGLAANRDRDIAYGYLKSRGLGVSHVHTYDLMFTTIKPWTVDSGRVVMPIYQDGKLVHWLARSYTKRNGPPYRNCPIESSIKRSKEVLFGLEQFKASNSDHLRIVEGVFDAMTLGMSAVACLKSELSTEQRKLIRPLGLKSASIIFDAPTFKDRYVKLRALKAGKDLSPFIRHIKIVNLPYGDVSEIGLKAVLETESDTPYHVF